MFLRKWETFISYKELVHHLNGPNPETGVLGKGHQMGSSSCNIKTIVTEIMLSAASWVAANKGNTEEFLKVFLQGLGKVSVVSEVQQSMVREEYLPSLWKLGQLTDVFWRRM